MVVSWALKALLTGLFFFILGLMANMDTEQNGVTKGFLLVLGAIAIQTWCSLT